MNEDLGNLEREVEIARARLSNNLSTLRSAENYTAFKEDLKDEARSALSRIVENVKARAAANPAAALAIGAGLAWRLIQRPPVTAALIGAGIVSLLRTTPVTSNGFERDYYSEGKTRLKQQAEELADVVKDQAVEIAGEIKEQASELAATASDKVADAVAGLKEQAASLSHRASQTVDDGWRSSAAVSERVGEIAQRRTRDAHSALNDPDVRDDLLLGLAGVAVVAALGIAYQRGQSNPLQ
jgi:phage host-nuclease inhibitor protein Gam